MVFIAIAAILCLCCMYSGVATITLAQEIWTKEISPIRHDILWISSFGTMMTGLLLLEITLVSVLL